MDLKLKAAMSIIKNNRNCSFTTLGADGTLNARIMTNLPSDENRKGDFYFATTNSSRKVREIRNKKIVMIMFYDSESRQYVAVKGRGAILTDNKTKSNFWKESWKAFWPEGKISDSYVIVKVTAQEAELLQTRAGTKEFFYFEQ